MKKAAVVALVLCLPALLRAGDVLSEFGVDRGQAEESFFSFVFYRDLSGPRVPAGLRALPPAKRAAAVNALGAFARSLFESKAFQARYAQARKESLPKPPEPVRSGAELAAEQKAELEQGIAITQAQMAIMPADQQAMLREMIADMRANQAQLTSDPKMLEQADKQRYAHQMGEYEETLARIPENPREPLRAQLQRFLELTEAVDYEAGLVQEDGYKRFSRRDYEARPAEWKKCFRAGKDACEAARAFALKWIGSL